jgi:uncharacterized protein YbbC (DUF1343 family)
VRVKTGLEVLAEDGFAALKGKKVGLVTNHTGIMPDGTANMDALRAAGVNLLALYGPEHGVRGDVPAGKQVASYTDKKTGIPVYSLYGATKVPTAAMLRGLDLLLFDIQDIGSRSYTYVSTLGLVMEGAAKHGVPLTVLDRPNPVGGNRVEGGPTKPGFVSFISQYPVSYLHGLTMGEFARMANGRGWLKSEKPCELNVVPCANLTRRMATWEAFGGLRWVRTSPNVPRPTSPHYYAATGIVGELSGLAIGIGTDKQFELAGAPFLDSRKTADLLNRRAIPGVTFAPARWTPNGGVYRGKSCGGVRIVFADPTTAPLTRLNFELMAAFRALAPGRGLFTGRSGSRMFDLACGTDALRRAYQSGATADDLWATFNDGADDFKIARQPYLIYSEG